MILANHRQNHSQDKDYTDIEQYIKKDKVISLKF
jgi:hypothetical protein